MIIIHHSWCVSSIPTAVRNKLDFFFSLVSVWSNNAEEGTLSSNSVFLCYFCYVHSILLFIANCSYYFHENKDDDYWGCLHSCLTLRNAFLNVQYQVTRIVFSWGMLQQQQQQLRSLCMIISSKLCPCCCSGCSEEERAEAVKVSYQSSELLRAGLGGYVWRWGQDQAQRGRLQTGQTEQLESFVCHICFNFKGWKGCS